jgi:hypothetical protein
MMLAMLKHFPDLYLDEIQEQLWAIQGLELLPHCAAIGCDTVIFNCMPRHRPMERLESQ